jgi:hypothetical protein
MTAARTLQGLVAESSPCPNNAEESRDCYSPAMLMPGRHPCHSFLTGMEFLHAAGRPGAVSARSGALPDTGLCPGSSQRQTPWNMTGDDVLYRTTRLRLQIRSPGWTRHSRAHRRIVGAPPAEGDRIVRGRRGLRGRGLVHPGLQAQAVGRRAQRPGKLARGDELTPRTAFLRPHPAWRARALGLPLGEQCPGERDAWRRGRPTRGRAALDPPGRRGGPLWFCIERCPDAMM